MTDEESLIWCRIAQADGEAQAVGEVDLARCAWGLAAIAAIGEDAAGRHKPLVTMRRRVRKIVSDLRFGYNKPVLDGKAGYFVSDDPEVVKRFCASRHRRAMTSLVVESIVRKQSAVTVGVQRFLDFLKSEETRRRRVSERTGEAYTPVSSDEVIDEITAGMMGFGGDAADVET